MSDCFLPLMSSAPKTLHRKSSREMREENRAAVVGFDTESLNFSVSNLQPPGTILKPFRLPSNLDLRFLTTPYAH